MGNTNFQTIHQMGTAISNMVKQATGRDNVQNIDMEHVTVAQNHRYEEVDISGQVVSFQAGEAGLPFEKMVVQIMPVQSGSGDPSPDNIRPITGWTMVNVYQAGQNMEDARVFRFTTPSEAGIVYGGTLDVTSGVLTVEWELHSAKWGEMSDIYTGNTHTTRVIAWSDRTVVSGAGNSITNIVSDYITSTTSQSNHYYIRSSQLGALVTLPNNTDENTEIQVLCKLESTIVYNLSDLPTITTILGLNNIWADTGDIEVKFTNIKEMY